MWALPWGLTLCPGLDVSPIQGHAVEGPKGDVAKGPLQDAVVAGGTHVKEEAPRGADADVPAAQTCLKEYELSSLAKSNAALLGRRCSEFQGAPVAMMCDVGQPVKDHYPRRQVEGLHSTWEVSARSCSCVVLPWDARHAKGRRQDSCAS